MMKKTLKELILWGLISLPFIYLALVWNKLPEQIATHFALDGSPNGWSSKIGFIFVIALMTWGVYLFMLIIPFFDPKKKIKHMGEKYYKIRFMLTLFMAFVAAYLIYNANGGYTNPHLFFAAIGLFFIILGNYLQVLRPNYFIGIRTPWTLESEQVWRKTHRLSGRLWVISGVIIAVLGLLLTNTQLMNIFLIIMICSTVLITVVYSYSEYKKEIKTEL